MGGGVYWGEVGRMGGNRDGIKGMVSSGNEHILCQRSFTWTC